LIFIFLQIHGWCLRGAVEYICNVTFFTGHRPLRSFFFFFKIYDTGHTMCTRAHSVPGSNFHKGSPIIPLNPEAQS
jgi:hypothetical protein